MFGPDRICGVVAAPTARAMAQQLHRALRLTRTVELRLDWLRSRREYLKLVLGAPPPLARITLICTFRRREAGGRAPAQLGYQLACLRLARVLRNRWYDVEIETAARFRAGALRRLLSRARLLISYHNFRTTPSALGAIARRLEACGGDAIKVATHCHSLADSLRLLRLARGRRDVVAVPMGEMGLPARVLALREGSALAYASVGEATAPGQLSLEEMKRLYRADKLNRRTRVYGVIGDPIEHSLSPLLHNAGFRARRINAVYLPVRVRDLRDFLAAIEPLGIRGFSVTVPHKERILRYLDGCDPLAAEIGAVNTVVVRGGGKLYGYNTDYVGVLRALDRRMSLAGSRVLIYGAGGAARAVAFALARAGAAVSICARRSRRARALARAAGGEAIERRRLAKHCFDAIVNATPVGMHPDPARSPLEARELNCRLVFDLIYRPMRTRLLQLARRRGIETVPGVGMFVTQGAAQWEIWMGERAPVEPMRRAVLRALRQEERSRT